jgi:RHS repeat-associated protein
LILEQADASGLMYRRNRYYNPQTGRFTQPDPIGVGGGLNAYGFAAGDPVNYSDPLGLCPLPPFPCPHIRPMQFMGAALNGLAQAASNERVQDGALFLAATFAPEATAVADGIELLQAARAVEEAEKPLVDFVVNSKGDAAAIPDGARGPHPPDRGTGMSYTGGSGGKGMNDRVTGVRIMDADKRQGRRVNYMNKEGQTADPKTGQVISRGDPRGHILVY